MKYRSMGILIAAALLGTPTLADSAQPQKSPAQQGAVAPAAAPALSNETSAPKPKPKPKRPRAVTRDQVDAEEGQVPTAAGSQDGTLAFLADWVGHYPDGEEHAQSLWQEPTFKSAVIALVGETKFNVLEAELHTTARIIRQESWIYISARGDDGVASEIDGSRAAAIFVNTEEDEVKVCWIVARDYLERHPALIARIEAGQSASDFPASMQPMGDQHIWYETGQPPYDVTDAGIDPDRHGCDVTSDAPFSLLSKYQDMKSPAVASQVFPLLTDAWYVYRYPTLDCRPGSPTHLMQKLQAMQQDWSTKETRDSKTGALLRVDIEYVNATPQIGRHTFFRGYDRCDAFSQEQQAKIYHYE